MLRSYDYILSLCSREKYLFIVTVTKFRSLYTATFPLNSHDAVKYATTQHTKRLPTCVNFTTCSLTAAEVNMLLIVLNQHCSVLPVQVTRLLEVAVKNRAVAATDCNERSSRSHCLFRLTLSGTNHKSKETCSGKFSI